MSVVIALSLTSCDSWLGINTSPDSAVTVTCDVVLPTLLFFAVQENYDNAEYNNYLSQCLTTTGKSQTSIYSYKVGWGGFMDMNRHPQWRRHYYDIGINGQYLIADAEAKGMRNYVLIAKTLQLWSLMETTDEFGEMAMTEAYVATTPGYDDQQMIYDSIARGFDELIACYNDPAWTECSTNGTINYTGDRMYGGDLHQWYAFLRAMYARFLVRNLPNMNNTPAMCQKIVEAVDAAFAAGFTHADYKFDGGSAEKNCMWGPSQPKCNLNAWPQGRDNQLDAAVPGELFAAIAGFYASSLPFANSMKKTYGMSNAEFNASSAYALDPRAARMMEPRGDANKVKALRYLKNNIGMDVTYGTDYKVTYFPDLFCTTDKTNPYTQDNGYIPFITEEELLFIKAEAQYWMGQKQEAYTTTKAAVERSMQRWGVIGNLGEAEKYLLQFFYDVRMPAPTPAEPFTIADLMQQKYIALFLQGEQWTDVRRYNYSSPFNGIQYDNVYVYQVLKVKDSSTNGVTLAKFEGNTPVNLRRPYNIYQPHWDTDVDQATNFTVSANAWINRLQPDPETEDKYNLEELKRLGAYKNHNWLRKRMIWQMRTNDGGACTFPGEGEWMLQYASQE